MSRSYPSIMVPALAAITARRASRRVAVGGGALIPPALPTGPARSRPVTRSGDRRSGLAAGGEPGLPRGDLGTAAEAQLGENVLHVALRGALRNDQTPGDVLVGQAAGHQVGHLLLPPGQRGRLGAGRPGPRPRSAPVEREVE